MSSPTKTTTAPRLALTRVEAAKAMGISARSVDSLIADRTSGFPVARVGRKVLIPTDELRQWLSNRASATSGRGPR